MFLLLGLSPRCRHMPPPCAKDGTSRSAWPTGTIIVGSCWLMVQNPFQFHRLSAPCAHVGTRQPGCIKISCGWQRHDSLILVCPSPDCHTVAILVCYHQPGPVCRPLNTSNRRHLPCYFLANLPSNLRLTSDRSKLTDSCLQHMYKCFEPKMSNESHLLSKPGLYSTLVDMPGSNMFCCVALFLP